MTIAFHRRGREPAPHLISCFAAGRVTITFIFSSEGHAVEEILHEPPGLTGWKTVSKKWRAQNSHCLSVEFHVLEARDPPMRSTLSAMHSQPKAIAAKWALFMVRMKG
jgi:hypothetical protein